MFEETVLYLQLAQFWFEIVIKELLHFRI